MIILNNENEGDIKYRKLIAERERKRRWTLLKQYGLIKEESKTTEQPLPSWQRYNKRRKHNGGKENGSGGGSDNACPPGGPGAESKED